VREQVSAAVTTDSSPNNEVVNNLFEKDDLIEFLDQFGEDPQMTTIVFVPPPSESEMNRSSVPLESSSKVPESPNKSPPVSPESSSKLPVKALPPPPPTSSPPATPQAKARAKSLSEANMLLPKMEEDADLDYTEFDDDEPFSPAPISSSLKLVPPIAVKQLTDQTQRLYGEIPVSKDWYYGDISRPDAEKILISCGTMCFLVRTSSVEHCYALSKFFSDTSHFIHYIIAPTPTGYGLKDCLDDTASYATLDDLINNTPVIRGFISVGKLAKKSKVY